MNKEQHAQSKSSFLWKIRPIKLNKLVLNSFFISAIFIFIAISFKSYWQLKSLMEANRWVIHSHKVMQQVDSALYRLSLMESTQRAYLITKNAVFLQEFNTLKPLLDQQLMRLQSLTLDNMDQNRRIIYFTKLAEQRITLLIQLANLKTKDQFNTPESLAEFYQNNKISDHVKSVGEEIKAVEQTLLQERNKVLLQDVHTSDLIIIFGSTLSIVLLIIPFILANFELINRKIIEHKNQDAKNHLKQIIESTSDGIAALDEHNRVQIFNERYQRQFKKLFDCALISGMTFAEIFAHVPEQKRPLTQQWLDSLRCNKETVIMDFEYGAKKTIFELNSNQITNKRNQANGLVHTIRDITKRVREHIELEESYEKLTSSLKALECKNEQITLMIDMSDMMLATNSLDELSSILGKYAKQLLPFSNGYLYVMHPSKNYLEKISSWGTPTSQETIFSPEQCWAIRLGRPYKIVNSNQDLLCEHFHLTEDATSAIMCVPLTAHNDIYGLLYIETTKELFILNPDQQLLITAFSELTALALANVRLRENLRHQSIRDPLTGLYNRRFLEDGLLKQKLRAKQDKTLFAVLMLDLDHFKKINDTFGHDAGDAVLKEIGEILEQATKPGDIASRYGGEEFMLLFHDIDLEQAKLRAEQIRLAVSKLQIKYGAQLIGPITISVGIAIYPLDSDDIEKLIELADKALYAAKKQGRNTVVARVELSESSHI